MRLLLVVSLFLSVPARAHELPPIEIGGDLDDEAYEERTLITPAALHWGYQRYVGQAPAQVQVCANLDRARDTTDFSVWALKVPAYRIARGRKGGDPYLESFLALVPFLLKHPAALRLIELIVEDGRRNGGVPRFESPLRLGSLATAAALELLQHRDGINALCDRVYLLLMVLRTLRERPEWIRSERARELCREIEAGFAEALPSTPSAELRSRVRSLVVDSGVAPGKIGYDPELRTRMTMTWSGFAPQLKIPWMLEMLRAGR
ncbi:MAG TPA: hypothetical protein VM598_08290 [Bdellovibrionota bacterium]|nr:hypothetical protein [Bdellovibrionota bacterium]